MCPYDKNFDNILCKSCEHYHYCKQLMQNKEDVFDNELQELAEKNKSDNITENEMNNFLMDLQSLSDRDLFLKIGDIFALLYKEYNINNIKIKSRLKDLL